MTSIPLEISVVSADVLKKPTFFNKPHAYVVITLAGNSVSRQRTPVDERNGEKPYWNFTMRFEVERSKLQRNSAVLVFQLCRRRIIGDKDIGLVYVPVKELFDGAGGVNRSRPVAFSVSSRSGKPKGVVYLSYVFGKCTSALEQRDRLVEGVLVPSAPSYLGVGTVLSCVSRFSHSQQTTSALGQGDRGVSGQNIPRPISTGVGGGERVLVPSAPPYPVPSAPPYPSAGTIMLRESHVSRFSRSSETTCALGQGDRGVLRQNIPRPVRETTIFGGGERVLVTSAPPCPVPSAPPCLMNTSPSAPPPYIGYDFGSLI